MNPVCQRVAFYVSFGLFVLSLALIAVALVTPHWIEARVVNSKVIAMVEGNMHAGLFSGVRVLDWGLGVRVIPFSVLVELEEGTSFFGRGYWLGTVSFTAIAMLFTLLALPLCLLGGMRGGRTSLKAIYACILLAVIFLSGAMVMFYINYSQYMVENVLLDTQLQAGFSTRNKIWIGYSFHLFVTATTILLLPVVVLYIGSLQCVRRDRVTEKTGKSRDPAVFLY